MRNLSRLGRAVASTIVTLAVSGATQPLGAAPSPFIELAGTWSGSGQIRLQGGQSEQLSCRAYYTPKSGGAELGMAIRCASTSYKIELRSALQYDAGAVTGSWEERTFNVTGDVSGRATGGQIHLTFKGNVTGSMSVTYSGANQNVTIATSGSELSGVTLRLARGE